VSNHARRIVVRAPAKINLTLRVGARRDDGYHDVETVLQAVALSDTVTVTPVRGPFALDVRAAGVPADRSNLVWRAADSLWREAGRTGEARDARVTLIKRIPAAAGLGGGSADAAAALIALNAAWKLRRSPAHLVAVAADLGADVPFLFAGGTALGTGRGDRLFPLADITPFDVVIVTPGVGVATADAYRWLDDDRQAGLATGGAAHPPVGLEVGWAGGPLALANDLEGPVARRSPDIGAMIEACRRAGAAAAAMTGSGSAVFGLFPRGRGSSAARRLQRPGWTVRSTRTLSRCQTARYTAL
jgi:4-diphosphocytidyl-2-C-methyl-D-erythritol kinase